MNTSDKPSELNLNARFQALIQQRDNAMNTSVLQAGEIADLQIKLAQAHEQIAQLTSVEQETAQKSADADAN